MFNPKNNNRNNNIDTILDDCLERILVGGESIESCLTRYRQYADELEPLLQTALATRRAALAIEPSPEFKARARYQFHATLNEMATQKRPRSFGWRPRFNWAVAASLALSLMLSTGGVVAAASNSMPDSPLYQVKLATEQIQLMLTTSPEGKAELNAKLADRRLDEIVSMAAAGNVELIESTNKLLDAHLALIDGLPGNTAAVAQESDLFGLDSYSFSTRTVTTTILPASLPDETPAETVILGTTMTGGETPPSTTKPIDGVQPPGGDGNTENGTWRQQEDYADLVAEMQRYSIDNIDKFYEAIESASEDVLQALLQTLAVLENRALGEAVMTVTETATVD